MVVREAIKITDQKDIFQVELHDCILVIYINIITIIDVVDICFLRFMCNHQYGAIIPVADMSCQAYSSRDQKFQTSASLVGSTSV